MTENLLEADVVIAGAGLAGLVAAHELLDHGKSVLLLDKDVPEKLGGLAKESFGGVHLIGTPHQRRSGIADSPELALQRLAFVARDSARTTRGRAAGRSSTATARSTSSTPTSTASA